MNAKPEALFAFGDPPHTRFGSTNEQLAKSLLWHAQVTAELQRRVLEASTYVRTRMGDRELLRILEGKAYENETPHRPEAIHEVAESRNT